MEEPQYDYAVIGGDMRQVYLVEELAHHQTRVCHYALAAMPNEDICSDAACITAASSLEDACLHTRCTICPIPFSPNGCDVRQEALNENLPLDVLLTFLQPNQYFFAGCIPKTFKETAQEKGIRVYDLMLDSTLVYYNTIATAEGALCEAISHSPMNLHGSNCAVLGFGKCGSTLVHYLKGMSCHLYVCTDDEEERAKANLLTDCTGSVQDFKSKGTQFDFIFNTIPASIVDAKLLKSMKQEVTIIDISSAPGGVDFGEAKRLGITAILCPGLPGKYAPSSSAKAIKSIIETQLDGDLI